MSNIQEVQQALQNAIDYFDASGKGWLQYCENDTNEEAKHANIVKWSRDAIDFMGSNAATFLSFLSYVIITEYNGELIISPWDAEKEIRSFNYFLEIHENPDGSMELSAYREEQ